jgi:uncharacterized CHY-type Zn-finger protein
MRRIGGLADERIMNLRPVRGVGLDEQTRCGHYHGPTDIIAIKTKCCGEYYACKDCHSELAGHGIKVWPRGEWDSVAILCGACRAEMTIAHYMACESRCPACGADFNPRCSNHYHFYFEMGGGAEQLQEKGDA